MSNILITGGTGTFGQALSKFLLNKVDINKIVIYSRDEQKQEKMANEFSSNENFSKFRFLIGDVRDKQRLKLALKGIDLVVHAAALKIVPASEYNPMEYIKTNVIGTQNLIEAIVEIDRMPSWPIRTVLISTDKAVNPVNLYGATKLCAEKLFVAANNINPDKARFIALRYGNVANSRGSVIPIFKEHFDQGKPLPITDMDMTRFWITIDFAIEFVWDNLIFQQDYTKVHYPKMASFRVADLAKAFYLNKPNEEAIKIIGVRNGEKIHESIDVGVTSDTNDYWLSALDLRNILIEMGVINV